MFSENLRLGEEIMKINNSYQGILFSAIILFGYSSFVMGRVLLAPIEPKLTTVYVQQWGSDLSTCGQPTSPCATINYGIFRISSTTTEPPFSEKEINTIYVGSGEYSENVDVNKPGIKIVSFHGSEVTIISAEDTQLDTVNISVDGIYFGKFSQGFTLTGSISGSGLYSTGSYGVIEGNQAIENGTAGFYFREQVGTKVRYNLANLNGVSGFYFNDFDDGNIDHNHAFNTTLGSSGTPGPGRGSGFWIDFDCNNDVFESNVANRNERSGVFYRRFGVTQQIIRHNSASKNQLHGFVLMGDEISIINNTAVNNESNGFLFMGYDRVDSFTYNSAIGNTGAGVVFGAEFLAGATVLSDVGHNNYINNDSGAGYDNCGVTNNLAAGSIVLKDDFFGNMNIPGPGTDPADALCGFDIEVETPASQMNVFTEFLTDF